MQLRFAADAMSDVEAAPPPAQKAAV